MYKVVIIDDEAVIREGLKTIIDWEKQGFVVAGEAASGREGLQLIERSRPDLAIVDIKMPGMNGLEMINSLREQKVDCEVIILTGYSEFAYAQKAVELGVKAFVLKPIDPRELTEKVKTVFQELNRKEKTGEDYKEAILLARDKLLEKLVTGEGGEEIQAKAEVLYELHFPWPSYRVILIEIDYRSNMQVILQNNIRREIERFAGEKFNSHLFSIGRNLCLLLPGSGYGGELEELWQEFAAGLHERYGVDIYIAVGKEVKDLKALPSSYHDAESLLLKRFIYGANTVICRREDPGKETKKKGEGLDWEEIGEKIFVAVFDYKRDLLRQSLAGLREELAAGGYSEEFIRAAYIKLYVYTANRLKDVASPGVNFPEEQEIYSELCGKKSLDELHEYFEKILLETAEYLVHKRPDGVVRRIIDYIYRYYEEDLKLEYLAKLFGYNPAYLGKIFKAHTGEYFNTYLDMVRMEKAKELLKEDWKVYQIAAKVGYQSLEYFGKKFRKLVGMAPTEYRKLCQEERT